MISRRLRLASIAVVAALTPVLSACVSSAAPGSEDERVQAVVSFYPLQFVTERVGGEAVSVVNLTPAGASSHGLELRPSQIVDLTEADLVVYQSGFQPGVDEAVQQHRPAHVVDAAEHAGLTDGDPHFWLDPTRLAAVVPEVAKALADVDPPNALQYEQRAAALVAELRETDTDYRRELATCRGATVVTSHTAFGYLADRYGLQQVGIRGIDPEVEPSPARLREVSETVTAHRVRTIFFEVLTSPQVTAALADDLGVATAVLDPIENQTLPGEDYLDTTAKNLEALTAGLRCES